MNLIAVSTVSSFSSVDAAAGMWFMQNFTMFKSGANFTFR